MAESSSELSLDKAKSAIRSTNVQQPELSVARDLVDKPFDQLTTDDIGKLGETSEGTVVLLHALAGRFGSSGEINSADLNDIFELGDDRADAKKTLQGKLRSMQVAVSKLQETIGKATGNVDQTTRTLAQEFQQLIADTQQQVNVVVSTAQNSTEYLATGVIVASLDSASPDFKSMIDDILKNQDLGFGKTPMTDKDVKRFSSLITALYNATMSSDLTGKKNMRELGYQSKSGWSSILPAFSWTMGSKEKDALTAILKKYKAISPLDQRILSGLRGVTTKDSFDRLQARFTVDGTQISESTSVQLDDKGKFQEAADKSQVVLLLDLNNDDKLNTAIGDIGSEAALAAAINTAMSSGLNLGQVFKNVTGRDILPMKGADIVKNQQLFHESLVDTQAVLRSIFGDGMNYGLQAVMMGHTKEFQDALSTYVKTLPADKQEIQLDKTMMEKGVDSAYLRFVTKYLLPIGTLVLSGGKYVLSLAHDDVRSQEVAGDAIAAKNKGASEKLKQGVFGKIKEGSRALFEKSLQALGTLAKYTTLKIDEENIGDALKNGLASATETIVGLNIATVANDSKSRYHDAVVLMQRVSPNVTSDQIKTALLATEMDNLFRGLQGNNFSFSLNPLLISGTYEHIGVKYEAGKQNMDASRAEQGVTLSKQNMEQYGVKAEKTPDGKYKYTFPEGGKINMSGAIRNIPYSIEGGITSFPTYKIPQIFMVNTGEGMEAVVRFRDATNEENQVIDKASEVKITSTEVEEIQLAIIKNARLIGNNETRRESFTKVLNAILDALKHPEDKVKLDVVFNDPTILKLVGDVSKLDSQQKKITALEAIISGLSGDQRYRDIRSILERTSTGDLAGTDLDRARTILKSNFYKSGTQQYYRISEVDTLTSQQVTTIFRGMKMSDIQAMLDKGEQTQKENNNVYTAEQMTRLGIADYGQAAATYDTLLADKSVASLSGISMNGVGFEMSHMVRWNKDGKTTSTSFEGLKPTTGASLIIKNIPPEPVDVPDKSKFVNSLSEVQLAMYAEPIAKSLGIDKKDLSIDQIRMRLVDPGSGIQTEFYYAQSPNCTNAVVFMRVKINGQITLPSTLEQAASFVASQTKNDTNMVLGGATPRAFEGDKTTEQQAAQSEASSTPGVTPANGGSAGPIGTPASIPDTQIMTGR